MISDDISGFFDEYGWHYERRESITYRTGFSGENGAWDIWVRVKDSLVVFSIAPYVTRPEGVAPGTPLLRTLLQVNHELNLAKLAINDDQDVALSVEMPAEGFVFSHFSNALTALAHYADEYKARLEAAVDADAAALAAQQDLQ